GKRALRRVGPAPHRLVHGLRAAALARFPGADRLAEPPGAGHHQPARRERLRRSGLRRCHDLGDERDRRRPVAAGHQPFRHARQPGAGVARHPRSEAGRLMLRAALLALALAAVPALAQEPAAGTIDFVEGDATVENAAGAARLAREGDAVRAGETITTFARAEVHLRMADGGYLSVRENSKLTLTRYAANGDERDECLIDLARGAFRSVTVWIGLFHPQAYSIHTATATIGIRGTDHEPMHLLAGDPRGEPGTYEKV